MPITPDEFIRPNPFDQLEDVPTYTETDEAGFQARIDALTAEGVDLGLPLTRFPGIDSHGHRILSEEQELSTTTDAYQTRADIINSFFKAVCNKNTEIVVTMVSQGLVSPDVTGSDGGSPLAAAVRAGNPTMVRTLLDLGAEVNAFSNWNGEVGNKRYWQNGAQRTALMVAAAMGNLIIVKILMETYKADDSLIAPDGMHALRLAVSGRHREVVEYLPSRRGGEWLRWKTQHAVAVRRIKRAGKGIVVFGMVFFWYIPKAIVWWLPKHLIVLPIRDATVWSWKQRGRFANWCKVQAKAFPGRCKAAAKAVGKGVWTGLKAIPPAVKEIGVGAWNTLKGVPKFIKDMAMEIWRLLRKIPGAVAAVGRELWKCAKAVPKIIAAVGRWLWRCVKAVPKIIAIVGGWIWESLKRIGGAVAHVFLKLVALLHTVVSAVIAFFRGISLADIWNGFCAVLRAIFVDFPIAVWKSIHALGDVSYKVMKAVFGGIGAAFWWIGWGIVWFVTYVPSKIVEILANVVASIGNGFREVGVWINPKM